jgi:hypothetical protein
MRFCIVDKPGTISVREMQSLFESSCRKNDIIGRCTHLDTVQDAEGLQYADEETDTLWLGFALGLRCAERIVKAKSPHHCGQDAKEEE